MATHQASPPIDSLVLYKVRPARVRGIGEKIEIELQGGQNKRVRPKDIALLHPGPLRDFAELTPPDGEIESAWELLEGGETTLRDLAELAFDAFTPATAWAAWQLLAEDLAFTGTPERIQVRPRAWVERERAERAAKAAAEQDWQSFMERLSGNRLLPDDRARLVEVERLALGQGEHSRVLLALGIEQTPEQAHRVLLRVGYWPHDYNPHPPRCGVTLTAPEAPIPELPAEDRLDLTHLPAYAIDDEGNQDPDDALSLDGERLWVHVADVAALVASASDLDREARTRGANLYLPDGMINMLPAAVTEQLGLGLQSISPALSFGMRCDAQGELSDPRIERTWVRVERLSYETVEGRLDEAPFAALRGIVEHFRARREARGAINLDLPEVSVRVRDGEVGIRLLPRLCSRELVMEAMLMAGEVAARFCQERALAIPFATQAPPEPGPEGADLASRYARRRCFKPTRLLGTPDPHAGLGLERYTRATSPLRRYSDLLVHQQIRAALRGQEPLAAPEVALRIAEAEQGALATRRAERLSNQHWKLIYLRQQPRWRGEGVVVAREERKVVVMLPALAMEARVRAREGLELNRTVELTLGEVDLPALSVGFQVRG